jgi:hypothetical protein
MAAGFSGRRGHGRTMEAALGLPAPLPYLRGMNEAAEE